MSLGARIKRNYAEHRVGILITLFILLFLVAYLLPRSVIFIDAGKAGVRYKRFGGGVQTNLVYGEGTQFIWPWDTMTIYDVRVNQLPSQFAILTSNGLSVQVDVSFRYYPMLGLLGLLHKQIGPDYVERIVIPTIQASVRKLFGQYTPELIYRTQDQLLLAVRNEATQQLQDRFIVLDDLLIKSIVLPETVQNAIQAKLVAQQQAEEMEYRINLQLKEKERRIIESQAVAQFNTNINNSLSEEVLRFRSIEAFLELAKSGNSNTIVLGPGNIPIMMALPPSSAAGTSAGASMSQSTGPIVQPTPAISPVLTPIPTATPASSLNP
jgi:prohibitin 2